MTNFINSQFLDIVECQNDNPKILIWKFRRPNNKNDIMQGSKVIVRENQVAFFIYKGELADMLETGTTTLTTGNLPLLSSLRAFPFKLSSPMSCEVYFLKTNQFFGNKWATKTAVIKSDKEVGLVRIRGFGNFSFRVSEPLRFMQEVFINETLTYTYDIIEFLKTFVAEAFSVAISASDLSVFSLQSMTIKLSEVVEQIANERIKEYGIIFTNIVIEGISLPDEVEDLIDEQTGIGLAKKDMDNFIKYQATRAMRERTNSSINLSGKTPEDLLTEIHKNKLPTLDDTPIYADAVRIETERNSIEELKKLPPNSIEQIKDNLNQEEAKETNKNKNDALILIKNLLDQGILTEEEFNIEKEKILNSDLPWF